MATIRRIVLEAVDEIARHSLRSGRQPEGGRHVIVDPLRARDVLIKPELKTVRRSADIGESLVYAHGRRKSFVWPFQMVGGIVRVRGQPSGDRPRICRSGKLQMDRTVRVRGRHGHGGSVAKTDDGAIRAARDVGAGVVDWPLGRNWRGGGRSRCSRAWLRGRHRRPSRQRAHIERACAWTCPTSIPVRRRGEIISADRRQWRGSIPSSISAVRPEAGPWANWRRRAGDDRRDLGLQGVVLRRAHGKALLVRCQILAVGREPSWLGDDIHRIDFGRVGSIPNDGSHGEASRRVSRCLAPGCPDDAWVEAKRPTLRSIDLSSRSGRRAPVSGVS